MSLRELESRTGLSRGYLSHLERGHKGTSDQNLRSIASALGIPVAAINREEEP